MKHGIDDELSWLAVTNGSAQAMLSLDYRYNDAQQITQVIERALLDGQTRVSTNAYTYDARDQIVSEDHYSTTPSLQYSSWYAYDAAQNRTSKRSDDGSVLSTDLYYYVAANKLDSIAQKTTLPEDGDGLSIDDEVLHGTSPYLADTDADGWSDGEEVNIFHTCPWKKDSDGDGVIDTDDDAPTRPDGGVWFGVEDKINLYDSWRSSVSKPNIGATNNANCRYWYDLAGNLASSKLDEVVTEFRYNAQNKLTKVMHPDASYEFAYDSQNRRTGIKKDAGSWRNDVHDGMICVVQVKDGSVDRFFARGIGVAEGTGDVISEYVSGTPHYYCANHRGDTVIVLAYNGGE
jgi:YD repeat-containing protein